MKIPKTALWIILFFIVTIVGTVVTVLEIQRQQDLRSRATGDPTVTWSTSQSAASSCPTNGSGAAITVSFSNLESNRSSTAMNVLATDKQTGESITLSNVTGGETKTGVIQTGETDLSTGTVEFKLTWTDGHSGQDVRTANYKAVSNCTEEPTPTPTEEPSGTPSPSPSTTPTVCPTLAPVQNVRIECPNCE